MGGCYFFIGCTFLFWRIWITKSLFVICIQSIKKGNFLATYDSLAYKHADVVIVDINLDVEKKSEDNRVLNDYDVDLTGFKSAI